MKKSSLFNLNWQDLAKGFIVAVLGAIVAIIAPSIQAGNFTFDWTTIWHTGVAAGVAYIGKNFFTPPPKTIEVDPTKTEVIDSKTKQILNN